MSETEKYPGVGRVTMPELADIIGITKQRIHKVKDEGRIVDLEYGSSGRASAPFFARILRGERERPGPLTEYIAAWERKHGVSSEENTKEVFEKNGRHG